MFVRIILLITDVTGNNDCSASNSSASFCFLFLLLCFGYRSSDDYIIRKAIRYTSYDQQDVYEK